MLVWPTRNHHEASASSTLKGVHKAHFLRTPQPTDVPMSRPKAALLGLPRVQGGREGGRKEREGREGRKGGKERSRESSAGGVAPGSSLSGWPALGPQARSQAACLGAAMHMQNARTLPAVYFRPRDCGPLASHDTWGCVRQSTGTGGPWAWLVSQRWFQAALGWPSGLPRVARVVPYLPGHTRRALPVPSEPRSASPRYVSRRNSREQASVKNRTPLAVCY